jgi:hypothetical protein
MGNTVNKHKQEKYMKRIQLVVSADVFLGACGLTSYAQDVTSDVGSQLAVIRQSTAKYNRVENAIADGYVSFPVADIPGGVDALYVNLAAGYDGPPESGGIPGVLKLEQPEGLGYLKLPNGELRLASVFFFKPYASWPAPGTTVEPTEDPPVWLGHEPVANVNIGSWEMEVWVWVYNPNGLFDFVNPRFLEDWDTR